MRIRPANGGTLPNPEDPPALAPTDVYAELATPPAIPSTPPVEQAVEDETPTPKDTTTTPTANHDKVVDLDPAALPSEGTTPVATKDNNNKADIPTVPSGEPTLSTPTNKMTDLAALASHAAGTVSTDVQLTAKDPKLAKLAGAITLNSANMTEITGLAAALAAQKAEMAERAFTLDSLLHTFTKATPDTISDTIASLAEDIREQRCFLLQVQYDALARKPYIPAEDHPDGHSTIDQDRILLTHSCTDAPNDLEPHDDLTENASTKHYLLSRFDRLAHDTLALCTIRPTTKDPRATPARVRFQNPHGPVTKPSLGVTAIVCAVLASCVLVAASTWIVNAVESVLPCMPCVQ